MQYIFIIIPFYLFNFSPYSLTKKYDTINTKSTEEKKNEKKYWYL